MDRLATGDGHQPDGRLHVGFCGRVTRPPIMVARDRRVGHNE
jgi:hypothetical protein